MNVFILVFVMNGLLMHVSFDDYNNCLEAGKRLGNKCVCIESLKYGNISDIYPDLVK